MYYKLRIVHWCQCVNCWLHSVYSEACILCIISVFWALLCIMCRVSGAVFIVHCLQCLQCFSGSGLGSGIRPSKSRFSCAVKTLLLKFVARSCAKNTWKFTYNVWKQAKKNMYKWFLKIITFSSLDVYILRFWANSECFPSCTTEQPWHLEVLSGTILFVCYACSKFVKAKTTNIGHV